MIAWSSSIEPPWTELEPVRVGAITRAHATPDRYLLFTQDERPKLRVDVYCGSDDSLTFKDAVCWSGHVAVGWGAAIYIIDVLSGAAVRHELQSYFSHFYVSDHVLLAASGERIRRFSTDGSLMWTSAMLGIDGVVVDRVTATVMEGSGDWDPPGGWRPFRIRLDTGDSECLT